jgi:hypothetical protein
MERQPVRVIVYAWGKRYVDRLLNYAVPSLLAPGNLPILVKCFDCTLVFVTEKNLFGYVSAHPLIRRVESFCPVRLVSLDDLVGEPWQYGISLAYALFRGFSDLGSAMTETYLLFLNADFILADGCYEHLIPYMKRGDSVLLSPSYCTVAEEVEPILDAIRADAEGALAIPPRRLARMIIDYRHNTFRAKTISQRSVHFEYMDQAYWQIDEGTIIGHQMPISMIAMRPEKALNEINTFWDWGIIYEFCPSRKLTVLGDSDEFLILELRSEETHLDLVRLGPTTPIAAAARMGAYLTRYQLDNSRFPLTLHAKSVPNDIDGPRSELRAFLDGVLKSYGTGRLPDHRNHPQWIYHKLHLARSLEIKRLKQQLKRLDYEHETERARVLRLRDSTQRLVDADMILPYLGERPQLNLSFLEEFVPEEFVPEEFAPEEFAPEEFASKEFAPEEFATRETVADKTGDDPSSAEVPTSVEKAGILEQRFAEVLQELAGRHQAVRNTLRSRLAKLEKRVLPSIDDFFGYVHFVNPRRAFGGASGRGRIRRIGRDAATRVFGSIPYTRYWHPLHFVYRDVAAALEQADVARRGILFVGDRNGLSSRAGTRQRDRCLRISTAGLVQPEIESVVDEPWCGLSVVEMGRSDFQHLRRLHRALMPHMLPGGRIVMFWVNHSCESGESLQRALVQAALMEHEGARVRFVTSTFGWGSLGVMKAVRGLPAGSGTNRGLALLAALLKLLLLNIAGRRPRVGQAITGNCLGMIIEIEIAGRLTEASLAARPALSAKTSGNALRSANLAAD